MLAISLNSIQEAIEDIKNGKLVIVVDDEDRENEGDFVTAAQNVTPEIINFMAQHGRGLVCAPMCETYCEKFGLDLMVKDNTSLHSTPFTVSVDLLGNGCTTGISAHDRAKTIQAFINKNTKPEDFGKPGHIFPLKARKEGVLRRAGHTEAVIDLARMAGMEPVGVLVEIMNEDGTMARLPDLMHIAQKFDMKIISIKDLIAFRLLTETQVTEEVRVNLPTAYGEFELIAFTQIENGQLHLALKKGQWQSDEEIMVRVHSSCLTGDILSSLRCDCGEQLHEAMRMIQNEGKGLILYMNQEGRGIGLLNKLKAYKLQEEGLDTVEANNALGFGSDMRDYGIGAQILRSLQVTKIKLLSNNPKKRVGLESYNIEIVDVLPIICQANIYNEKYLNTKKNKLGHLL